MSMLRSTPSGCCCARALRGAQPIAIRITAIGAKARASSAERMCFCKETSSILLGQQNTIRGTLLRRRSPAYHSGSGMIRLGSGYFAADILLIRFTAVLSLSDKYKIVEKSNLYNVLIEIIGRVILDWVLRVI